MKRGRVGGVFLEKEGWKIKRERERREIKEGQGLGLWEERVRLGY